MTSSTPTTGDSPCPTAGAALVLDQLRLVPWYLTDLLYEAHAAGASLEDVTSAWLWLEAQAADAAT